MLRGDNVSNLTPVALHARHICLTKSQFDGVAISKKIFLETD